MARRRPKPAPPWFRQEARRLLNEPVRLEPGLRGAELAHNLLSAVAGACGEKNRRLGAFMVDAISYAYEMARLDRKCDWNGKRVAVQRNFRLRREHFRKDDLAFIDFGQMQVLWPFVPWLVEHARWQRLGVPDLKPEVWTARSCEIALLAMLTKPWDGNGSGTPPSYWVVERIAQEVASRFSRRAPATDTAALVEGATESLRRRTTPVRQYIPRSKSVDEAIDVAYAYMFKTVANRMKRHWRRAIRGEDPIAASTRNRWRRQGHDPQGTNEERAVRAEMRQRQRHERDGYCSISQIARECGRPRGTVRNALRRAERKHGFAAEQTEGGVYVTAAQKELVIELMGLPRRRSDRP